MRFRFDSEDGQEAHDKLYEAGIAVNFVRRGSEEVLHVPDKQSQEARQVLRANGLPISEE